MAAPSAPVLGCTIQLTASSDLAASVQTAPAGSHICLASGTYRLSATVVVKPGDTFSGPASARPVIDASATDNGFDTHNAANVVYENLVIEGAQSPGRTCPTCGRGIWGGDNMEVFNVEAMNNAVNGIGGGQNSPHPWLIVGSQFVGNGSQWAAGFASGGVKSGASYTIFNSTASNNIGQGIWCDVGCNGGIWKVEGDTVTGNTGGGIRYEISDVGAVISGNLVNDNNTSNRPGLGGIQVASSGNAMVVGNTATNNGWAQIIFGGGGRRTLNAAGGIGIATSENNVAQNNIVSGVGGIRGCSSPGVSCSGT